MQLMVEAASKETTSQRKYAQLQAAYESLQQEHESTKQRYDEELESLKQQLAWFKRQVFAPSVRIVVASSKMVSKRGRTGADSEIFRRTQTGCAGQALPTAQPISP